MGRRREFTSRRISILKFRHPICSFCQVRRANWNRCSAILLCLFCAESPPLPRSAYCETFVSPTWANPSSKRRLVARFWQSQALSLAIAQDPGKPMSASLAALRLCPKLKGSFAKNWATRSSALATKLWRPFWSVSYLSENRLSLLQSHARAVFWRMKSRTFLAPQTCLSPVTSRIRMRKKFALSTSPGSLSKNSAQ